MKQRSWAEAGQIDARVILGLVFKWFREPAGVVSQQTVGFLYGAGAETLIFATGTSGKKSENFRLPAEKPKSAVDTQKTKKNRCLGIRC